MTKITKNYAIREFASHFRVPLSSTAYDERKIRIEWRNFRRPVSLNLPGKEAHARWKNILSYKRKEFPNICVLAELLYCPTGSNSAVERGFSILTMMLSDIRFKKSYDLMNFRIALKINDRNWTEKEGSEILRALEIYLSKSRRKRKIDEPSSNHTVELTSSESEDSQSNSSDYESYNLSGKENSYNEQSDEGDSL